MLHVMYDVPLMRFYGNTLSLALCDKRNSICRNLKVTDMSDKNYPFLKRKIFAGVTEPIGICYDNMCLVGSMGVSARPVIELAVLPMDFYDLDEVEQKKISNLKPDVYNDFMKMLYQYFQTRNV